MATVKLTTPLTESVARGLNAGDMVELSGVIYTARDAAHKRLMDCLEKNQPLPFELAGAVIYYVGPSPAPPGRPIGSAGPTTSGRMDAYAPRLIALGLRGMIGKGGRSPEVVEACKKHGAVYFAGLGGAGALMAQCVKSSELVAYEDLGPEAVRRLTVEAMPLVVINDARGRDLYAEGRKQYQIG